MDVRSSTSEVSGEPLSDYGNASRKKLITQRRWGSNGGRRWENRWSPSRYRCTHSVETTMVTTGHRLAEMWIIAVVIDRCRCAPAPPGKKH